MNETHRTATPAAEFLAMVDDELYDCFAGLLSARANDPYYLVMDYICEGVNNPCPGSLDGLGLLMTDFHRFDADAQAQVEMNRYAR